MNKNTTCQTIAFQDVAPHSKEIDNQEQELRGISQMRASYVMIKWRGNILYLYDSYDL